MSIFSRFKKSEYAKHSTILMSGTVFSMVLQTVSVAWLGVYYSSSMWGIYEYFCTAYSIFLIVATGRYELAIMLPKEDSDGYAVAVLSAGLSVGFGLFGMILIWLSSLLLAIPGWLFFLPPTLSILGIYYSCNYWLNRKKQYVRLAVNRVVQGILFVFFNLLYAFVLPDRTYGLILGYMTAQGVVTVMLILSAVHDYHKYKIKLSFKRTLELAKEYISFPKLSCISGVINNIAVRLPVFLLGAFGGSDIVGQYSMMNRILGAPITVISEAIRDVFRQKASREYAENGQCEKTFNTTFKTLALAAIIPFVAIMAAALPALRALFGNLWDMAGYFIILMTPFYYIKFIISPLTFMSYIARKQGYDMRWQILLCVCSAVAFTLGHLINGSPYLMLLLFGAVQAVLYFVSLVYMKKLSKGADGL